MITFTALESEYIRTKLYGPNEKRRKESILLPLLQDELHEQTDKRISELKGVIEDIQQIGRDAEALAKAGKKEDSPEYKSIQQKALNHSPLTKQYMLRCYEKVLPSPNAGQTGNGLATKKQQHAEGMSADLQWPSKWKKPILQDKDNREYLPQTPEECMYQYCFFGLWEPGKAREIKKRQQIENYKKICDDPLRLKTDKQRADNWLDYAGKLKKRIEKAPQDTNTNLEIQKMGGPLPYVVKKQIEDNKNRAERSKALKEYKSSLPIPTEHSKGNNEQNLITIPSIERRKYSNISYAGHQNDIYSLIPSQEWELYIDESGKDDNFKTGGEGVIAGVLTDTNYKLPPQPQLHASTDKTKEEMKAGDDVIKTILEHHQTGVLALPARVYQDVSGWGELIASFIGLVLRMIPLGGHETKLTIFVEGRSPYDDEKDFTFMQDACRYQLIHTLPERAKLLHFQICKMDKFNPMNAYPDLVAHSCYMRKENPVAKARFCFSGWNGTCFLNYDATQICNFLDYFHAGRTLQPVDWENLVQEFDSSNPNFISPLLQSFGEELRMDVDLWKVFLDFFLLHLDSKAIDLRKLGKQVMFLKQYQPENTLLPLRLRLIWLTAKLAESNHRGSIIIESEQDFRKLMTTLFEEDAPLTCWAVLHLAVNYTNAFNFEMASNVIKNYLNLLLKATWNGQCPDWNSSPFDILLKANKNAPFGPAAITGLKYYAQLVSTHGQHLAFEGKNEEAITFFDEAIELFSKLNTKDKESEIAQTRAYLLTSLMDCDFTDLDHIQSVASKYFETELDIAAKNLSKDTSDENKYRHHILLRYAMSKYAPTQLKTNILSTEKEWETSEGHPWEMIEFYRALLVSDSATRIAHLQKAHELCKGYDATLHVIDAVILGTILLEDNKVLDEYLSIVEKCVQEVPAMGDHRIQVLREQPIKKLAPLELAKEILPFNFR